MLLCVYMRATPYARRAEKPTNTFPRCKRSTARSAVGLLIQSPREAWRLLSPELTQNSLSTLSAANALLPCPINGCPSPKERPIRAASSREPLPACGPCVSQGPCELSASPVRQVVQAGWGAGRWSGGRWRSEERGWRFDPATIRFQPTSEMAGDQSPPWRLRAGPSLDTPWHP